MARVLFHCFQIQSKNQLLNLEIMKTKVLTFTLLGFLFQSLLFAQDVTTVNATSNEISDNLDLRAVASIFGDSNNLEDFERRLNDPKSKISNLDLNFDRQVDYLRVIEVVEKNTHLIILQAVLEKDVFQDVATIEVERDRNNQVQIQVVGDVFMYGPNYIYEPVYVSRPVIYTHFWVNNYNPYYSPYYFNYYPTYYYAWAPCALYRYRRDVHVHINQYNYYNYSDTRRSSRAVALYETRRSNGYETRNYGSSTRNQTAPTRTVTDRNSGTRNTNSINRTDVSTSNAGSIASTRLEPNNSGTRNTNSINRTDVSTSNAGSISSTRLEPNNSGTRNTNSINRADVSTSNAGSISSTRLEPNNSGTRNTNSINRADVSTSNAGSISSTRSEINTNGAVRNSGTTRSNSNAGQGRTEAGYSTRSTTSQQAPTRQVQQMSQGTRSSGESSSSRSWSARSNQSSSRSTSNGRG